MNTYSNGNLADMITGTLPVYIRKRSDAFSSITLRGTSANHTAILVNGINLNSLTLGHSNLGNVDMFLFDGVDIQLGSAGAIYGSDAIGGTINLKLDNKFTKGTKIDLRTEYSSLQNNFNGIKIFHGNNKFESKTRIYYVNNKNEFEFKDIQTKDIEHKKNLIKHTKNSRKENYGFLQQFIYRPSIGNSFNTVIWYQKNWYQVQPLMSENDNEGTYKKSLDEYIRVFSGYERLSENYKLTTNVGFIKDKQIYNGNEDELISTKRIFTNNNLEYTFNAQTSLDIGLNYKYITPDVYTYPKGLDEHRADFFALFQQTIIDRLKYSLNIRQAFVSGYKSPFTPAIGLNYSITNTKSTKSSITLNLAKGYKIPTFNQRYWGENGNPDINPEKSLSTEIGLHLSKASKTSKLFITLNGYYTNVDNWILWVNKGGEPKAENVRQVECIGGEFISNLQTTIDQLKINYRLNYSFTSSLLKESVTGENIGKQLSYTPRHNANSSLVLNIKSYTLKTDYSYTGERHNYDYNKILEAYSIVNLSFSKSFQLRKNIIDIKAYVNNLFDTSYQNIEFFATPGRNYNISLNIKIN